MYTQLPEAVQSIAELALPFAPLSQHVLESFASIALSSEEQQSHPGAMLAAERSLIKWYLDRNQIFQAVALAREWLVSWVMAQVGLEAQMMDKRARLRVEQAIGQAIQRLQNNLPAPADAMALPDLTVVPALGDIVQLYIRLGDLRNDLMHAGKRKDAPTAEKVESTAKALCQKLADLPLPSLWAC